MKVEHVPLSRILTPQLERTTVDIASEYPIAGVLGFGRGLLLREAIRGTGTQYTFLSQIHEGQVVYSKVKAFEGAFTVVNEAGEGRFVSPEFPVFDIAENVSRPYMRHFLASDRFMSQIQLLSSGIGARRERVSPTRFLSIKIPLPSVSDQRRIATHLDSVEQASQKAVATSAKLQLMGRALVPSLFRSMSADALSLPFGSLFQLQRRPVEIEPDRTYTEVGVRSFGNGLFKKRSTGEALGDKKVYEITPGDLIISNVFAWEGAVGVADETFMHAIGSHRFMTWTPTADCVTDYVSSYLTTPTGIAALAAASPGSAGRNRTLSIGALESIHVPRFGPAGEARIVAAARRAKNLLATDSQRLARAQALLPAARNEVFNALL